MSWRAKYNTCVNEVASLIEKGTSMTLANVLANNVLPDQTVSEIEELHEKATKPT